MKTPPVTHLRTEELDAAALGRELDTQWRVFVRLARDKPPNPPLAHWREHDNISGKSVPRKTGVIIT